MSHIERTIKYLKKNKSITSKDAFVELGNTRLSATIFELRKDGWNIATTYETKDNRFGEKTTYARYILKKPYKKGKENE